MAEISKDDEKILSLARKRLDIAISATTESRENQREDKKFFAASPDNQWQWHSDTLKTRKKRPSLTINKLPQHVKQVTNDQRQNRPSVKVIPVNDEAHLDVAEVYGGMIRHIEYTSAAALAYDTACENQVVHGEGFWRIITEYESDTSFDQVIKIMRVRDSFKVFMDPSILYPWGEDAQWAFVIEELTKEDYAEAYPDAMPVSRLSEVVKSNTALAQWVSESTIQIAEYFCIEKTPVTLNLYKGNRVAVEGSPEAADYVVRFGKPEKTRKTFKKQVKWYKTNGFEILEEGDWAGSYIPVVRVVGNEVEIDGQIYVSGLVRNAKDAQRMYNYWVSQEAEMLALAPKAPFIGYAGQFEGYEEEWKTANTENHPYLQANPVVDDTSGQVLPLPQRAQPPMVQSGLIAAKQGASEDIKATTGQYDASLGMVSNERSGKAILARQKEGDVGTFHFVDNLAMAVRYTGIQLVDLIPKIYDTERVARILGEDGESKVVHIDPTQQEAVRKVTDPEDPSIVIGMIYNPSVGKYDVMAVSGPGYATKRQEALEAMAQLLQGNPDLWKVAGDLFVKNMDWPGAQELAKRFQKVIDPKLLQEGDDNPALQQAQAQIQQMAMELDQMHQMLVNVDQSMEAKTMMIKAFEAQIKGYDAETKRIAALAAGMNEEQVHEVVRGTIDAMIQSGDLAGTAHRLTQPEQPSMPENPATEQQEPPESPMMEQMEGMMGEIPMGEQDQMMPEMGQ